jgi:Glycosyl transferase family 2
MKVWVFINSYNYREYCCEAVGSALAQTRKPDSVVVIDDGSTDGTVESSPETKVIPYSPHSILPRTRICGIPEAHANMEKGFATPFTSKDLPTTTAKKGVTNPFSIFQQNHKS